jgi:putative ABC transport system permease protein
MQARAGIQLAGLLAGRSLRRHRARAVLCALTVALGAATLIAGGMVSSAIIEAVTRAEDVRAVAEGLFGQLEPILQGIGGAVTVAAGFIIFNAFGMSLTERRQQLGLLRTLGVTRGQLLAVVLAEAALIGAAGVGLGLAAGPILGRGIVALLRTVDSPILGGFIVSPPRPGAMAAAALLGLAVSLAAALVPARAALRVSPLAALREETPGAIERGRRWPAVVGAGLGLALAAWVGLAPPARWVQPPMDMALAVMVGLGWLGALALALPGVVGAAGAGLRRVLGARPGAVGVLVADNFQRGRTRLVLNAATLAIGLTLTVLSSGFFKFYFNEMFGPAFRAASVAGGWTLATFPIEEGVTAYAALESLRLPDGSLEAVRAAVGDRALVSATDFIIVPELSYFYDAYFTMMLDPAILQASGFYFEFTAGSWESALPLLEAGCAVLIAPAVASNNKVGLGDTLSLTGRAGPVPCVVAGIGQPFAGASLLSSAARAEFLTGESFVIFVSPVAGRDPGDLEADMLEAAAMFGLHSLSLSRLTALQAQVFDQVPLLFNGLLLLAVVTAALGIINTTLLSVSERRRELAQLRALGATRGQILGLVTGEAVLVAVTGAALGLLAGAGIVVVLATVYGGSAMGVANYDPWGAAWRSLPPALATGLWGMAAAPVVCAGAAWVAVRGSVDLRLGSGD